MLVGRKFFGRVAGGANAAARRTKFDWVEVPRVSRVSSRLFSASLLCFLCVDSTSKYLKDVCGESDDEKGQKMEPVPWMTKLC